MLDFIQRLGGDMPGGFFVYRADEREEILYLNDIVLDIFGCSTREEFDALTGGTFSGMVHPDDRDAIEKSIATQVEKDHKNLDYVEYRITRRDGTVRYVDDYGRLVHTEEYGDVYYVLIRDITETERRAEREKRFRIELELQQERYANSAKTLFLSNMSHDIRTPMNAIIGFTNLALKNPADTEKTREYLEKIKTSGDHLLSLINDVLEMSRIESGKIELDETPCSLPEILHSLNTIITAQVEAKKQELLMDALNVTDENIICDKLRLNQILLNLLSNATKYTQEGGRIFVRVVQSEQKDGEGTYQIRVKDNGRGMKPEFAARVFEAFTREKTSTVSGIQGTGLGMAITKRLVELMGGTIEVETEEGKGTVFTVTISFKTQGKESESLKIAELTNMHTLVVEDDFDTCNSITRLLSDMGLRPEGTLRGAEATLKARQAAEKGDPFRAFIIDYHLRDLNGVEVSRQIRAEVEKRVPILLMSAYDLSEIKAEAKEAGVTAFCNKPVFPSELHSTLLSLIGGSAGRKSADKSVKEAAQGASPNQFSSPRTPESASPRKSLPSPCSNCTSKGAKSKSFRRPARA